MSSAKAVSISKGWMEESLGEHLCRAGTKYDANLHWGNGERWLDLCKSFNMRWQEILGGYMIEDSTEI